MIRDLYAIVDKPAQRMLIMLLIASTLAAAAQGIAFAGLFPFLTSFISDDDAVSLWLMFILIATIITWMMVLFTGFIGRASSAAILRSLLSMLGERISRLPLSYFRQGVGMAAWLIWHLLESGLPPQCRMLWFAPSSPV